MKFVPESVGRALVRQVLITRKNSPHILFAAGIVGVIGGTFLACRATLKLGDTLDEFTADIEKAKLLKASTDTEKYSPEVRGRVMTFAYVRGTFRIGKLYAPAGFVLVLSIGALTGSHITLTRRNASLTAAYATLLTAYEQYRERIKKEIGTGQELDLYRGVTREMVVDEEGKSKEIAFADPDNMAPYARLFDEYSTQWRKDPNYNLMFIRGIQEFANHRLNARGHVFLNEIYDDLGLERTSVGQIVGWVKGHGDGYIDFGLDDENNERFLCNWENSVYLDFNVDGNIWELI